MIKDSTARRTGTRDEWIPLILGGIAGAVWTILLSADTAYADDCLQYVKNVKNFVNIPKGLLEDCMRTGSVQAIITGILGGMGGGAIAIGVSKGLKGAGEKAGPGPHVGETADGPNKGDFPETPPGQEDRNKPEACSTKFDRYRAALEEAQKLAPDIDAARKEYERVFNNHQMNLAKVTIQLGMDAADMASAGVGGVKGGMGVARAVAHAPEVIADLISKAAQRSGNLARMISGLASDILELMQKGRTFATKADDAMKLSAKAEARIAELVKEAAAMEGKVARYDELVRFARSADATLLERNSVSKSVLAAEEELADVNMNHQKILDRKQRLDNWAATEKASIANEDARKFANKHEEVFNERQKIQKMQEQNKAAAQQAHAEWQAKMNELSAARKELDDARAAARHLQAQKDKKILAEQEVRKTAVVKEEAKTRLEHAESEVRAWDEAEAMKKQVRDLEAKVQDLQDRLEIARYEADHARAKIEKAGALEKEAAAIETAKTTLDAKDAALTKAKDELQAFVDGPEMADYQNKRAAIQAKKDAVSEQFHAAKYRYDEAQGASIKFTQEKLPAELQAHGLDPDDLDSINKLPPDRLAAMRAQQKALDDAAAIAKGEYDKATTAYQAAQEDMRQSMAALDAENSSLISRRTDLESNVTAAKMELGDAQQGMHEAGVSDFAADARVKEMRDEAGQLRGEAEPVLDPANPDSAAALEAEHTRLGEELKTQQYDAAKADKGPDRGVYESKAESARQQADHANKAHAEAETNLARADEELKIADLGGTGEPLGSLEYLNSAQAKYNAISQEQERLRVKYEQMASGVFGNEAEATAIRQRIDTLEAELRDWKEPDWEAEAAARDPATYADWKADFGGPDPVGPSEAKMKSLEAKLADLRVDLATLERKATEQREQAEGKSTEALESERSGVQSDLQAKQGEVETARKESQTHKDEAASAEADAKQIKSQIADKERKKQQLEEEKRKEDEELAKLKHMQENPIYAAGDVTGVAPMLGSEWTPYHGSEAEKWADASHRARKNFDKFMDNITPDFLTAPFRWAGGKAGELFHKAFGGQSPEEVAAIIKRGDERVRETARALTEAETKYDVKMKRAHDLRDEYDKCVAANQ